MNKVKFKIVTPKGHYLSGEADIINVPLTKGITGILPNHFPLVSTIEIGELVYRNNGNSYRFAVSGGLINVTQDETLILANAIESEDQIDVERALKAKERAESRLALKDTYIDQKRVELALKRAMNRLKIARK